MWLAFSVGMVFVVIYYESTNEPTWPWIVILLSLLGLGAMPLRRKEH